MFTIDANGVVIDANSKEPLLVNGEKITLNGVLTQDTVNSTIQERLARQEAQHKKDRQKLMDEYEQKMAGAVNPEEAERYRKKIAELEELTLTAEEREAKKLAQAKKEAETMLAQERETSAANLERYKQERLRNAVISSAARLRFRDPNDALQHVAPWAKWEDVRDDEGKATGDLKLVFQTEIVPEEGKPPVMKTLSAEEAVAHLAKTKDYMINGSGRSGYGNPPSSYGTPANDKDLGDLPPRQRMAAGYTNGPPPSVPQHAQH